MHHSTYWLEPRGQWKWVQNYSCRVHLSATQYHAKRRPRRTDDKNGGPGGKCFRGLIHVAWIRRTGSDRMYFSIWKSMQLHVFIHLSWKRAKTTALLDSEATENFISMQYTKELWLPIKCLQWPWPVYNVDGMRNKNGDIEHYMDLEMQTGNQRVWLQFFLTNLADQKAILGYPWYCSQPTKDWLGTRMDQQQTITTHPPHQKGPRITNCPMHHDPCRTKENPLTNVTHHQFDTCHPGIYTNTTRKEANDSF